MANYDNTTDLVMGGGSLADLLVHIARRMPQLYHQSDDPDGPLPFVLPPPTYTRDAALAKAGADLAQRMQMTPSEITEAYAVSVGRNHRQVEEANLERTALRVKCGAMLEQVNAWDAPEEFESLRMEMLRHLVCSIENYCQPYKGFVLEPTAELWHDVLVKSDQESVARIERDVAGAKRKYIDDNAWLQKLHLELERLNKISE